MAKIEITAFKRTLYYET